MPGRLLFCLALLPLSGCGLIAMPFEALEQATVEAMRRDDNVYASHGQGLDLVKVGDSRETVHQTWGSPRLTHPSYPNFDMYLVVRSDDGFQRVLPGDYNKLSRTSLSPMRITYTGDTVSDIRVFSVSTRGSRRAWCDATECGELFIKHIVSDGSLIRNPLVLMVGVRGIDEQAERPRLGCEIIAFVAEEDDIWTSMLQFAELKSAGRSLGFITADSFLRVTHPVGPARLQAIVNRAGGGGDVETDTDRGADFQCENGQRIYFAVSRFEDFWSLDTGADVAEVTEREALELLDKRRRVRLPSAEP